MSGYKLATDWQNFAEIHLTCGSCRQDDQLGRQIIINTHQYAYNFKDNIFQHVTGR